MIRRDFLKLSSLAAGSLTFNERSHAFPNLIPSLAGPEEPSSHPGTSSYEIFANPETKYRPFVRWWWNGDRITADELLRELDVLKSAGIGGVEINPIKFPNEADPMGIPALTWLSDEWISMLKITLEGAKKRGLTCDMIVGSGWPYGGEFLSRKEQTQIVALGTTNISGPQRLQMSKAQLLDMVKPAFGFPYSDPLKELVSVRLVPAELGSLSQVSVLDNQLENEFLSIDIPPGKHVLYCLVKITGFMAVINGAPGASGPVLNHYDGQAVEHYLTRLSDKLSASLGPLGNYFRAFFTDSIELEGANWCDDMFAEFRKRRGYDLSPWLPFILFKVGEMGNAVKERYGAVFSPDLKQQTEEVRYDFEITKHELFQERFVHTFATWCNRVGVKSRMQAYGMDCDPIAAGMMVDIPECETWIRSEKVEEFGSGDYTRGRSYTMVNKFVSSAAHLAGKKLISAEDMTNTDDPFHTSLERIKIAADQSMLTGVTHSVLHGFNYSPLEAPFPGWVRYGTYFSERNPWWPYFRAWTNYKARLSAIFQQSVMQADVAILPPSADMAAQFGFQRDPFPRIAYPPYLHKIWEAIHQNGGGADYLSEDILAKSTVSDGQIHFGDRSYKAIVLPEVESIRPTTSSLLATFAASGGKVLFIGKAPHRSVGLTDHAAESKAVANGISRILKKYPRTAAVISIDEQNMVGWYRDVQQKYALDPKIKIDKPTDFISQLHYADGDRDLFFFVNYGPQKSNTFEAEFATGDKTAWLWDPETGRRDLYPPSSEKNRLTITLTPSESKLIVFEPASSANHSESPRTLSSFSTETIKSGTKSSSPVEGPWRLMLYHSNGTVAERSLHELEDFTQDDELRSFAGTAVYENRIHIDNSNGRHWLDLGSLHCVSELEVNGIPQGFRWYGDHLYEISSALHPGENYLSIKVVTTLGNYMKSLKHKKAAEVWTSETPILPMGLRGPVTLLSIP